MMYAMGETMEETMERIGHFYDFIDFSDEQIAAFRAALAALFNEFPVSPFPTTVSDSVRAEREWFLETSANMINYTKIRFLAVPQDRIDAIYALLK